MQLTSKSVREENRVLCFHYLVKLFIYFTGSQFLCVDLSYCLVPLLSNLSFPHYFRECFSPSKKFFQALLMWECLYFSSLCWIQYSWLIVLSFQPFEYVLTLPSSLRSDERSDFNFIVVTLDTMNLFSLATSKILSRNLHRLTMLCKGLNLFVFIQLEIG